MARDVEANGQANLVFVVDAPNRLNAGIGGHLRCGLGQYQERQLCVTSHPDCWPFERPGWGAGGATLCRSI